MLSNKQEVFAAFVDFRKAFDLINKQLLLTKLIQYDVTGKMYFAIKSMLMTNKSCVKVINLFTEYFYVENGVRQVDSISSTLFAIYINDLVTEINVHKLGIDIDGYNLAVLLYAEDLVLFTVSEKKLQNLIDIVYDWTLKWRISINKQKSNIVHSRHNLNRQTEFTFKLEQDKINIVKS